MHVRVPDPVFQAGSARKSAAVESARWSVPAVRHPNANDGEKSIWLCRNSMLFMETSAKTAANVAAIFEAVALKLAGNGGAAQLQPSPDTPAVSS